MFVRSEHPEKHQNTFEAFPVAYDKLTQVDPIRVATRLVCKLGDSKGHTLTLIHKSLCCKENA